ncbi:MAG: UDP-N-acetylmuramoyl-L-alanine--D-glutamate ligase [Firmicutes bacterium]|nr:UDP-N-acetylmuramoyl-L-alanine--D-glutamate ligase [Bacillota bacterium]
MQTNLDNMRGKKVLIVGLGRSGTAAIQALIDLGAEVSVQDRRPASDFDVNFLSFLKGRNVAFYFNRLPEDMGAFDMIILSPGASPELPFVQEGKEKGAEITGELEIAFRISKGNFVAITGTNGKTTTTTLVGEIFKASHRATDVVGNIGTAAISAAAHADENEWLITETSSFQLETTKYFKPVISAILNLTPDHLDRHHTMEAYGAAKAKIFANQTEPGCLIINKDDALCYSLAAPCKCRVVPFSRKEELDFGAFVKDGEIVIADGEKIVPICRTEDLKIIGDHNVENALAAAAIAYFAGIDPEVIGQTITAFRGVEHRIEYCGTIDGVRYYNDSKGTNTDATIIALKAIRQNVILIAGGDAKGQNFDSLAVHFPGVVKKLLLLGRDRGFIREAAEKAGFTEIEECRDIPACVKRAHEIAEPGDSVLLSPACASWDMYDNFEQRGEHFKDCVQALDR